MRLSESVARAIAYKLGHYVYVYINPIDGSVFYIGKGQGKRCLMHLEASNRKVAATIAAIKERDKEPIIELLATNCREGEAHRIETAAIELFGKDRLDNLVRGRASKNCRTPIEDVLARYSKRLRADITEPAVLIRISRFYEIGMEDVELYDATRSCWHIAKWRQDALVEKRGLAFAVFDKIIREVYEITGWNDGGTTFCTYRMGRRGKRTDRVEFVGVIARDGFRDKYLGRSVGHLFREGAQNPIKYVNL